jgi:O-antigen ligase/tetratricopeptide (TPR) repeat protein
MTRATGRWLRARSPADLASLAAAGLVFGWIGWDHALWDARMQLALHLVAVGVIAGLAAWAARGGELPRTPIDLPLLALLAAFAAATLSALNVGMSLRAMAAILATAAMLPVALVAVRHRPTWVGLFAAVPVLVMAVPSLVLLLARRVDWVVAGAPGLPPLRLLHEGSLFGSVAVPPFVIWPAWALAGLIGSARLRRSTRLGLAAVGIPLTILSGSRSAWLAIGVVVLVAGVPWAWRQRGRLPQQALAPRTLLIAVAAAVALGAVALLVLPRLTAVTSLVYRASLWRDTLAAWATDPWLGVGPGFMPFVRQAAAPDYTFPVRQPHSHNLPLGVLGDAGAIGLVAAIVLVGAIAVVAGPWRSRTTTGRHAALVLVGLAAGGLFEDLTFLPNFNLLAIGLLAVALTDAGAVSWIRPRTWDLRRRAAAIGAGALIALATLPATITADAGAIAHRSGLDAAFEERWDDAVDAFGRASGIDPWHPGGPKALALAAETAGRLSLARQAAETATALNPGDGPSWTNLAIICGQLRDDGCQAEAAARATATASFLGFELANAALAFESLGLAEEADDAYRRSLLSQWLTGLSLEWPRSVSIGRTTSEEASGAQHEISRLLAWWAMDEPIDPGRLDHPAVQALAHAILDERSDAEAHLEAAIHAHVDEPITWQVAIVVRDHWGLPVAHEQRVWQSLTGNRFPEREPSSGPPAISYDLASWRGYPFDELVRAAERLPTDPVYPWTLARTLP